MVAIPPGVLDQEALEAGNRPQSRGLVGPNTLLNVPTTLGTPVSMVVVDLGKGAATKLYPAGSFTEADGLLRLAPEETELDVDQLLIAAQDWVEETQDTRGRVLPSSCHRLAILLPSSCHPLAIPLPSYRRTL